MPPSPFQLEVEKCVPVISQKPEHTTQDHRSRLYSRREKLLLIGKNVDHDYDSVQPFLKELQDEDPQFFVDVAEILRFDGLVLSASKFCKFDGLFAPGPSLPAASSLALLADEITKITFTPSALERYAACPLRFFFDDLLHLRQRPDYDPDNTETAFLVRALLKKYTTTAGACRGVPDDAPLLFLEAVERHLQECESAGHDAFHDRFLNGLTAGLNDPSVRPRGLLAAFIEHEKNGPEFLSPLLAGFAGQVIVDGMPEIRVEVDRVDLAGETGCLLACIYTTPFTMTVSAAGIERRETPEIGINAANPENDFDDVRPHTRDFSRELGRQYL